MSPRALVIWLAFALFVGGWAISAALADATCNDMVCAMTRADLEWLVREILRLRALIGKECT